MNICVFDTETIDLEQPYCYNIGYVIFDTEREQKVIEKDFVIEQVWHNPMLFSTSYYASKKQLYISRMKGRTAILKKYGFVCQEMIRDFKAYNVAMAFAYNSSFDEKVFNFNCDYFKTNNPFDNIPIFDIRGFVHNKIAFTKEYQAFCEKHNLFTETGNYSTTAEAVTKFLTNNENFEEEHTALSDSQIELDILVDCLKRGCELGKTYKTYRSIPRKVARELKVKYKNNDNVYCFNFSKIRYEKGNDTVILTE